MRLLARLRPLRGFALFLIGIPVMGVLGIGMALISIPIVAVPLELIQCYQDSQITGPVVRPPNARPFLDCTPNEFRGAPVQALRQPAATPTPAVWRAIGRDGACPAGFPVKANPESKVFHEQAGDSSYDRLINARTRCYPTAGEAQAAGYRHAAN